MKLLAPLANIPHGGFPILGSGTFRQCSNEDRRDVNHMRERMALRQGDVTFQWVSLSGQ